VWTQPKLSITAKHPTPPLTNLASYPP